ncbi:MAG: hypothetical protein LUC16_03730 [Coprobacillus sp.]|nr:hypothetical protein [Coprobacillus sp.]
MASKKDKLEKKETEKKEGDSAGPKETPAKAEDKKRRIRIERRNKAPQTYIEAHNKAVKAYKRNCTVFIFIAIFNVIGSIFFVVYIEEISSMMGEFLCMGIDLFLFMREPIGFFIIEYLPWTIFLYLGVFFGTSALILWLGIFARMGKKKYFYASCIIYIIDWVFLILLYFFQNDFTAYLAGDDWNYNVSLILIIHIITAVFVIRAFLNYRKVYSIEYAHLYPEEVSKYVKKEKTKRKDKKKGEADLAIKGAGSGEVSASIEESPPLSGAGPTEKGESLNE